MKWHIWEGKIGSITKRSEQERWRGSRPSFVLGEIQTVLQVSQRHEGILFWIQAVVAILFLQLYLVQ